MIAILSLLTVLVISLIITRIATIALTYTGLSRQSAKFQARSAFTGVGFTTSESEKVVNHPVRRRILLVMMLVGNAGIVTAITTLILGFIQVPSAGSMVARGSSSAVTAASSAAEKCSTWLRKYSIPWAVIRCPSNSFSVQLLC